MSEQQPNKPQQYRVPRGLYYLTAAVMALWVYVVFFFRNPYTQSVSMDYYDRHPYDETSVWVVVLVIVPMIGLAGFLAWRRRQSH
jgi:hypothetical protein